MLKVLSEISHQQADVLIVAPVWKGQPWFPVLLSLLFDYPRLILPAAGPILAQESMTPLFFPQEVQLAVWVTSGSIAKQKSFQNKLQNSLWLPGGQNLTSHTTHSFTSGKAGVLNGTEIPFLGL